MKLLEAILTPEPRELPSDYSGMSLIETIDAKARELCDEFVGTRFYGDAKYKPDQMTLIHMASELLYDLLLGHEIQIHAHGIEHVPRSGGMLVLAHHLSHFDNLILSRILMELTGLPLSIVAASNAIHADMKTPVGKIEALHHPILINRKPDKADIENVRKGSAAKLEMIRRIKSGGNVLIYPEGGRQKANPRKVPPHLGRGFVNISRSAKAPILVVGVAGTENIFPPEDRPNPRPGEPLIGFRPGQVHLQFEKLIPALQIERTVRETGEVETPESVLFYEAVSKTLERATNSAYEQLDWATGGQALPPLEPVWPKKALKQFIINRLMNRVVPAAVRAQFRADLRDVFGKTNGPIHL